MDKCLNTVYSIWNSIFDRAPLEEAGVSTIRQERKHGMLIGAIDEGTSSTRFMVFSAKTCAVVASYQLPINQIYPKEGWVEQDGMEIIDKVRETISETVKSLREKGLNPTDIVSIGITNQRETTVLWDKVTGKPLHNAIVWMDMRTTETIAKIMSETPDKSKDQLQLLCGLPLSPYFSSVKIRWLIDNIPEVQEAIKNHRCMFGTIDSWILWNLTGGVNNGIHITDVTNASCTMLMNIDTIKWDTELCSFFKIPMEILPEIRSCSEIYGKLEETELKGVPISGCIGDQQAALVGHLCFSEGRAKCTYGTGCFLLCNTGRKRIYSQHGLLTTVAYQFGKEPPIYALEGSVAIAGAAFNWLRDNVNLINDAQEIDKLADDVDDTNGVYFVPAFSGLYAPYWEPNARGIICGISEETDHRHIIRATLEAICYQTKDIIEAMNKDNSRQPLRVLKVDGGMTHSRLLMQLQTDLLGIKVVQPSMAEITALGAAIAAGIAKGIDAWNLKEISFKYNMYRPKISEEERDQKYTKWKMAVDRSLAWHVESD